MSIILHFSLPAIGFRRGFRGALALSALGIGLWATTLRAAPRKLYNNPESVVFDAHHNRYLVSNKGDGKIIQVAANGDKRVFNAERRSCRGLHIVGNRLYAACNAGLAVIDLQTGKTITVVAIPGRRFLNDVAADAAGDLYVTDTGANRIFRIRQRDHAVSTFAHKGISHPNGILFDARNKRFLVCSWEPHPCIWAVRLADGAVKTLIKPPFANLDGLAADAEGRIYVSSGATGKVYRYDAAFRKPPVVIARGHAAPADIFINKQKHVLVIPNFGSHTLSFVPLVSTAGKPKDGKTR